jgi:translocation and assembly module TamB
MQNDVPSPEQLPPRRRRWLAISAWMLAGLLVSAALLVAAGWQALKTDAGTAWLLSHVSGLKVSAAHGSLQGGPFSAARVEFELEGSPVHVVVDGLRWRDLHWQWRPYEGAWTALVIDGLQAQRVAIRTQPSKEKSKPPATLRWPFELALPDARVQGLYIDELPPLQQVQARVHFGDAHGRQHRVDRLAFDWDRLHLRAQGQIATDAPMALALQADVNSLPAAAGASGPLATPWRGQVRAGGPLHRIELDATLQALPAGSGSAASLELRSAVAPFAAWPLEELQAQLRGLDLSALLSAAPQTQLDGHASVRSTGLDQPAEVDLQLHNALPGLWGEHRVPLRTLRMSVRGQPNRQDRLELQAFDLQLGNARQAAGRLSGSGHWQGDTLALNLVAEALQPSQLDPRLAAMSVGGPLALVLHHGGEQRWQATLDARLDGRGAARGAPPVRVAAKARALADHGQLKIDAPQVLAASGSARASAAAQAERDPAGRWQLAARGELKDFDPVPWWPGPEGSAWRAGGHRLNGRWDASAQLPSPTSLASVRGRADVELADSTLAGVPLHGQLALRAEGRAPLATIDAQLQAASTRLQAKGQLALQGHGGNDRWQVEARSDALQQIAPLWRLVPGAAAFAPSAGRFELHADVRGRWPAIASDGRAQAAGLKSSALELGSADLRWRFGGGLDAPLELKATLAQLAHGVQRADRIALDLAGSLHTHRLQLQADSAARPPAWTDALLGNAAGKGSALRLQAEGRWQPAREGGRWTLRLPQLRAGPIGGKAESAWLVADGLQLELGLGAALQPQSAQLAPGRLQALGATLRWSDARWQAGRAGAAPHIALRAQVEPLLVAPLLARAQPEFGWGGDLRVGAQVAVSSGAAFEADVVLERASGDLSVTDEGGTQTLGLSDLRLGLAAHQGLWYFTEALAGRTVGVLAGAQSLRLSPQAVWPARETPMQGVLELRVDNLGVWGPWTPPGWRLAGTLHTTATLGGRFGAPEYTGRLEGHHIGARNLLQGVNVTDGEVLIALKGPSAQIERFTLKGGEGVLKLEGGATFGETPRAQLTLNAGHFQLLGRVDRRIVASGQAALALEKEAIRLDGRFIVDEGLIDFSRGNAPTLDEDVTVVRRQPNGTVPAAGPAKAQRPIAMTLNVDLGERLRVRGRGLDALLRGELRMTTPGGRLAVNGTVRTENGTYAAYSQKLEIERGQVSFNGPVENPRLDIVALRPNLDVRVGVSVAGTALNPRVRLFSEPEMSDTDKLSWLVLGRAPEGLGRTDTALLQRAAMALLQGENESTTDKVIQAFGLSDFSLRQEGEGELRTTVVSLGRQISRRWYVGYERGINSTTGTWQAIYRIAQRFTLRAQTGDDNAMDLIWTWRWN